LFPANFAVEGLHGKARGCRNDGEMILLGKSADRLVDLRVAGLRQCWRAALSARTDHKNDGPCGDSASGLHCSFQTGVASERVPPSISRIPFCVASYLLRPIIVHGMVKSCPAGSLNSTRTNDSTDCAGIFDAVT